MNVEIHVADEGEGPPVVLLHGSLADPSTFKRLGRLLPGRRRIMPTMRGHGPFTPLPADYSLRTTEVDDLASVLDRCGLERADLIAHSTGGATALLFALAFPQRVGRLVLIEPTLLSLLPPELRARVVSDAERVVAAGRAGDHRGAVRGTLAFIGGARWTALPEADQERVLDALAPFAPAAATHIQALLDLDVTTEEIHALARPTTLVYGSDSVFFEPAIAERLRELRPDIPQTHVAGAGHNVHADQPDAVAAVVDAFLT